MKLFRINKKEIGVVVAFLLKYGFKWLQKMVIQFSLLAKKAVLLAYKRRHSVLEPLILIQNFVSGAISAMYKRMSASSHINVLAYLPILRSLLLKLITFQLFKHNSSQQTPLYQATNTTTSITSSYSVGFNFLSHRIQLSISKADHRQTTGNQPPPDQQQEEQEEQAITAPSEEAHLLMPPHNIKNNENNTASTVKATMTTLPPLHQSPGLNALAKYSKMDNTPRSRTKDDADTTNNAMNDDTVQYRGDTIPAVLFP
jgi:hypothetical protein